MLLDMTQKIGFTCCNCKRKVFECYWIGQGKVICDRCRRQERRSVGLPKPPEGKTDVGIITAWRDVFGFLRREKGKDVFVSKADIPGKFSTSRYLGLILFFNVEETEKGLKAIDIEIYKGGKKR